MTSVCLSLSLSLSLSLTHTRAHVPRAHVPRAQVQPHLPLAAKGDAMVEQMRAAIGPYLSQLGGGPDWGYN